MKIIARIFLFLAVIFFLAVSLAMVTAARADTIRLAPGANIGLAAGKLKPGDVLLLADGRYPPDTRVRKGGMPGKPITIRAEHPLKAEIVGGKIGLTVYQVPHVVVEGLSFSGQSDRGLWLNQASSGVVKGCRFDGGVVAKWGVFSSYADDILIQDNESFGQRQHGVYVSNSGDRPTVRYNLLHDNLRCGVQLNGDSKQTKPKLGKRGDGIIEGAIIEGNQIWGCGTDGGAGINLAIVRSSVVRSNSIRDCVAGGISLFSDTAAKYKEWGCRDVTIESNAVEFAPGVGRGCLQVSNYSTGIVYSRNTFTAGKPPAVRVIAGSSATDGGGNVIVEPVKSRRTRNP